MRWRWPHLRIRRKPLLITLAVLLIVLFGGGLFLLGTTAGARWLIHFALDRAPQEVTIERIEGRLAGPLDLRGIRADTPAATVEVGHVALDWAPGELLRKRLHIEKFLVADVNVTLLPAPADTSAAEPTPAEPQAPPTLPLEIVIDEARIARTNVFTPQGFALTDLNLLLQGQPDDYRLEATARLSGETVPAADLRLQAAGDLSSVRVDPFAVSTLEGAVTARAEAAWYPAITWDIAVTADSLAVGMLAPQPEQWPGRLSAKLRSAGQFAPGEPRGWAFLDTVTGNLRGHALQGHGRVDYTGPRSAVAECALAWATIDAQLAATVSDSIVADLVLACTDLAPVLPQAGGRLAVTAQASGPFATPRATAAVRVDSLSLPAQQAGVRHVDADLDVDLADGGSGQVVARIFGLAAGQAVIDTTVFTVAGTGPDHRLRLAVAGPQVRSLVTLTGSLAADSLVWTANIDTLDVANPVAGAWSLQQPAAVFLSKQAAAVDSLQLVQDEAALTIGGSWDPQGWRARGRIEHLPLALANELLPPDQRLDGLLEVRLQARGTAAGDIAGALEAGLAESRLVFSLEDAPDSLSFEDATLRAALGAGGMTADLGLVVLSASTGARVTVRGDLALPQYTNVADDPLAQPLRATLRADLPDLGIFEGLSPLAKDLAGRFELAVDAGGTVGDPEIMGELRATGITVTAPDLGITVTEGELLAQGDPAAGFTLAGGARSGEGSIALAGQLPRTPTGSDPVRVTITGDRFQGMDTPEIEVLVSPDLEIVYDGNRLDIGGTVNLPVVKVELTEVPESAVPVSRDAVILDEQTEPKSPPVDTWVDVQVVLGDEVVFRGFAMSIAMDGSVRVEQHLPNPPSVRGDIRIREGYYRAYGQDLTLDQGTISFVGPAENPNLNMRAYRETPDDVIAGVKITGTAEQPDLKVYSEPAMSETEAISYLLTGRPLDAGSGDDKARVASAAALMGSNVISSQLGSKIGLDEARVETGGSMNEASLVTGKYITPELYLSYAMGLFERSNLVRLRYIISPKWAVQTETGTTQGADVFYKIERGGD